ncbi:TPA: hypothetical protein RQK83_000389 [Vibrio vulnificus]|nr:hypothetical protein [Vibrio vulnificus]HAV6899308.1 hypothetical protein [Vibrio vulnificus]HDY8049415.1 hypothetical protein [Vibrio vulnificus]HDY8053996.1 hypothetical protein [Vibrio vulnificus]
MSAGALGGGAFSYLKPIDVIFSSMSVRKTPPEIDPEEWIPVLDLQGAFYIRKLVLTSDNRLESTIRIEWDGKTEQYTETQGGSNSSESIIVVGEAQSAYTNMLYKELIIKGSLKVWLNISKSSAEVYDARTATISYNYSPVVVETLL